jgi:hypothetical protein
MQLSVPEAPPLASSGGELVFPSHLLISPTLGETRRLLTGRALSLEACLTLPLVPWRCAPTTGPAAVRRLKPGLSSKGQWQRAEGRAGRHGKVSHAPLWPPKAASRGSKLDRVADSLPSHASRNLKNSEGWTSMGEMCAQDSDLAHPPSTSLRAWH